MVECGDSVCRVRAIIRWINTKEKGIKPRIHLASTQRTLIAVFPFILIEVYFLMWRSEVSRRKCGNPVWTYFQFNCNTSANVKSCQVTETKEKTQQVSKFIKERARATWKRGSASSRCYHAVCKDQSSGWANTLINLFIEAGVSNTLCGMQAFKLHAAGGCAHMRSLTALKCNIHLRASNKCGTESCKEVSLKLMYMLV